MVELRLNYETTRWTRIEIQKQYLTHFGLNFTHVIYITPNNYIIRLRWE